jgi:hypothetical protein
VHTTPPQPSPETSLITAEIVETGSPVHAEPWFHLTLLLLATLVLVAALLLRVEAGERVILRWFELTLPGSCTYRLLLGIPCPGCGLTRCFVSLAQGDWRAAWQYNAVGVPLFLITVAQIPFRLGQLYRIRHRLPEWQFGVWDSFPLGILVALLIIQWLWRSAFT